jgi:hypothetical protein
MKTNTEKVQGHIKNLEKFYERNVGNISINVTTELIVELNEKAISFGYLVDDSSGIGTKVWRDDLTRSDYTKLIFRLDDSKFYKNANYIMFVWREFPFPFYQCSKQDVMEKCQLFAESYDSFEKQLDSFPNGLYLLFKILELLGEEIILADFKPYISSPTIDRYDAIWKQFCTKFGWKFIRSR